MRAWVATAPWTVKPVPTMRPAAAIAPATMRRLRPARRRRMPRRVISAEEVESVRACVMEVWFRIDSELLGWVRWGLAPPSEGTSQPLCTANLDGSSRSPVQTMFTTHPASRYWEDADPARGLPTAPPDGSLSLPQRLDVRRVLRTDPQRRDGCPDRGSAHALALFGVRRRRRRAPPRHVASVDAADRARARSGDAVVPPRHRPARARRTARSRRHRGVPRLLPPRRRARRAARGERLRARGPRWRYVAAVA